MTTIPEMISNFFHNLREYIFCKSVIGRKYQKFQDAICFVFGHSLTGWSTDRACRRCNRYKNVNGEVLFYHNWEMQWGDNARCHDHKR